MAKHNAKRFDTKEKKQKKVIKTKKVHRNSKYKKNNSNYIKFLSTILIIIIIAIIIFLNKDFLYSILSKSKNRESESKNAVYLSDILSNNTDISLYDTKEIPNTKLSISKLFIKYENNTTAISFTLCNNDLKNYDVFNFTFSLLDENRTSLITYNLSSEETLKPNQTKEYILIATRDVSNASDFEVKRTNRKAIKFAQL